ncbi:hypothetical protein [Stenotrophomonas sp.]|uniref:hypothetical protein n=1 Tax=unclassified Stenotrophomonas TaxID=196198 RepID=UPI0028AB50BA|nr:hypothetical protein [Stenotrophomonas sp.]
MTEDSSGVSADIQDRMPVSLKVDQIDDWMAAPGAGDATTTLLGSQGHAHHRKVLSA